MRRVLFTLTVLALALPERRGRRSRPADPDQPANGAVNPWVPAFGWKPVSGADHYVFQMAADPGFNSPVEMSGDSIVETRNTYASWKTAIPNGNYWWHVRAVDAKGNPGPWSAPRASSSAGSARPTPLSPGNNATLSYPSNPTMRWKTVDGRGEVRVHDRVGSGPVVARRQAGEAGRDRLERVHVLSGLTAGTKYYWSVTPIDGEGNRGVASPSFALHLAVELHVDADASWISRRRPTWSIRASPGRRSRTRPATTSRSTPTRASRPVRSSAAPRRPSARC